MQGIGLPRGHCETECTREGFGTIKVELLEFKPGQVGDLDGGIDRTSAVFASVGTVLAVEVGVPVDCDQVVVVSHVSLLRSEGFWGWVTARRAHALRRQRGWRQWFRSRRCADLDGRGPGDGHTAGITAGHRGRGDAPALRPIRLRPEVAWRRWARQRR